MSGRNHPPSETRRALRCGFSTGTAATAAAVAALRSLAGEAPSGSVAVRLPAGIYLAVPVAGSACEGGIGRATVIKDGGDDPDITNGAEIRAQVRIVRKGAQSWPGGIGARGIFLRAGRGVGRVTKPGLPVPAGEPAVNPVPRRMLAENLHRELLHLVRAGVRFVPAGNGGRGEGDGLAVFVPFEMSGCETDAFPGVLSDTFIEVRIEVPRGEELARHTLNPRLGVVGGISILGTTGIVKPFSHEAYEETIQAALSVAASNGCGMVILSTGGKSERYARAIFTEERPEAFVQIADFFSFAVREARQTGFKRIVHSVFFGKAVKMARGHAYTHAHSVPMDLDQLAGIAAQAGYESAFCSQVASANTARHALEILAQRRASDIIESLAREALAQSARLAGHEVDVRLLLFDYGGALLADVSEK